MILMIIKNVQRKFLSIKNMIRNYIVMNPFYYPFSLIICLIVILLLWKNLEIFLKRMKNMSISRREKIWFNNLIIIAGTLNTLFIIIFVHNKFYLYLNMPCWFNFF